MMFKRYSLRGTTLHIPNGIYFTWFNESLTIFAEVPAKKKNKHVP